MAFGLPGLSGMETLMALTISTSALQLEGRKRISRATVTFDSSYPTGGEAFTPADFGLSFIDKVYVDVAPATGYVVAWDRSTSAPKLKAFYGDNNNASDGPLIEVPDTTNLSTVIVEVEVVGS